jgi:tetratricopeptide (TPR) repeat protein
MRNGGGEIASGGVLMQDRSVRVFGLVLTLCYAAFIVWLYIRQPQTLAEVTGSLTATVGAYHVNQQAFEDAVALFHRDQLDAARAAFDRADPAQLDARTQFYIAYSYYRSGWGRVYQDDELFQKGIAHVDKAIALAPGHRLVVDDPEIYMHNADELRAELVQGLRVEASDFNPMRVFRRRK